MLHDRWNLLVCESFHFPVEFFNKLLRCLVVSWPWNNGGKYNLCLWTGSQYKQYQLIHIRAKFSGFKSEDIVCPDMDENNVFSGHFSFSMDNGLKNMFKASAIDCLKETLCNARLVLKNTVGDNSISPD